MATIITSPPTLVSSIANYSRTIQKYKHGASDGLGFRRESCTLQNNGKPGRSWIHDSLIGWDDGCPGRMLSPMCWQRVFCVTQCWANEWLIRRLVDQIHRSLDG